MHGEGNGQERRGDWAAAGRRWGIRGCAFWRSNWLVPFKKKKSLLFPLCTLAQMWRRARVERQRTKGGRQSRTLPHSCSVPRLDKLADTEGWELRGGRVGTCQRVQGCAGGQIGPPFPSIYLIYFIFKRLEGCISSVAWERLPKCGFISSF